MGPRARRLLTLALGLSCSLVPVAALAQAPSTSPSSALPSSAAPAAQEHAHAHDHTHGPDPIDLDPHGVAAAAPYAVDAVAPWNRADADLDGAAPTADSVDTTSGLPLVHAVYLHPSDQPSRFASFAAMFEADARDASNKLAGWYGRGIRWDERSSTGGARLVDVTVVRSQYTLAELSDSTRQFDLVDAELRRVFTDATKKYVAWLDAGSSYCGQGALYSDTSRAATNWSNTRTTAVVYRPYDPTTADGGFCRGRTLLHELGHNFGALQGSVTPNDFDGAHCNDSAEDVMCYAGAAEQRLGAARADTGGAVFDYRNDDYWDAGATKGRTPTTKRTKLGWWTVNLSKYLCPTTASGAPNCALPNSNPGY